MAFTIWSVCGKVSLGITPDWRGTRYEAQDNHVSLRSAGWAYVTMPRETALPALRRQRQVDLCEASLGSAIGQAPKLHIETLP